MKTKFYWVALLASAAMIAQAKAGGYHGGGGGSFATHASVAPAFHSAPMHNFGGGRFVAPARFSAIGMRSPNSFRQRYISAGGAIGTRQFTPGNFRRSGTGVIQNQTDRNRLTRFGNDRLARVQNGSARQGQNGKSLPSNWRNHIAGQRSANWHRDWDRHRDHFWNGHRCRFVNGSWFIFDFGYPWDDYGYPYDYYAGDYYPDQYDQGEGDNADYSSQSAYDSANQYADSTVGAAQAQLSRQGYYQGKIDGVYGAATRRAVMRYQSNHGLRATGYLTAETVRAMGLPRVANN